MKHYKRIKKSILILFGMVFLIALSVLIICIYWLLPKYNHDNFHVNTKGVQQLFQKLLDYETEFMAGQIEMIKLNENLRNAWLAKDRDKLRAGGMTIFNRLRSDYKITEFYFIGLDKVCFLRLHKPGLYGDTISHFTLKRAGDEKTLVSGIELDKFGRFILRVVCPWKIDDSLTYYNSRFFGLDGLWADYKERIKIDRKKVSTYAESNNKDSNLVGYIELCMEIKHITPVLKKISGMEILFSVNKSYLNKSWWKAGMKQLGRTGNWDQLPDSVIIDSSMKKIPGSLIDHIKQFSNKNFKIKEGKTIYNASFIPLKDAGTRNTGHIITLYDISKNDAILLKKQASLHRLKFILITFSAIIAVFMFVLLLYAVLINQRLIHACKDMNIINKQQKEENTVLKIMDWALKSSVNAISLFDFEGRLIYVNTCFLKMWGYEDESMVLGNSVLNFLGHREHINNILKGLKINDSWSGESTKKRTDGSYIFNRVLINTIKSKNGKPLCIMASFYDISQLKGMEYRLKKSEKYISLNNNLTKELEQTKEAMQIMDAGLKLSIGAISLSDPLGKIIYVNNSFLKMWGYENEKEVLGKTSNQFWPLKNKVMDELKNKGSWKGNLSAQKKNDSHLSARIFAKIIKNKAGKTLCIMACFEEITELKNIRKKSDSDHPKQDSSRVIPENKANKHKKSILYIPCIKNDGTATYVNISSDKIIIDGKKCNISFFKNINELTFISDKIDILKINKTNPGTGFINYNLVYINECFAGLLE
ncbi:hypothetical protein GMMP13_1120015 [Candidatus Magnetomoraceae bacterium gMMP-13]